MRPDKDVPPMSACVYVSGMDATWAKRDPLRQRVRHAVEGDARAEDAEVGGERRDEEAEEEQAEPEPDASAGRDEVAEPQDEHEHEQVGQEVEHSEHPVHVLPRVHALEVVHRGDVTVPRKKDARP